MADTMLESLEEEIAKSFRKFAAKPTQSGRIQLRHDLLQIAGALEVEEANLPEAEAMHLRIGITDLKALAETVLVAPKESLITPQDAAPKAQPKPAPVPRSTRQAQRLASTLFRDLLNAFKPRR